MMAVHPASAPALVTSHNYFENDEYVVNGIQFMNFRMLSSQEIQRHAVMRATNSILYDGLTNNPSKFGLLDRRLGVGAKNMKCETCFRDSAHCVGHFGCIELAYPVFHVGYFGYTIDVLKCICKRCSRVLLPESLRKRYILKLSENMNVLLKKSIHKEIINQCKKVKNCPYCDFQNRTIKKFNFMKIFHMIPAIETDLVNDLLENNEAKADELKSYFGNACEMLTPLDVLKLFQKIPKKDYIFLLLFDNTPMDLICTHLPVPPCIIRPSSHNRVGLSSTEDELTLKLNEILIANESLKKRIQDGAAFVHLVDTWDFLQVFVSVYINSDVRNLPPKHSSVGNGQGLAQRLKGKEGRFRANLSGKRVNFSARTVISPDPNMGIDEVGIPLKTAMHMTYPVQVTPFNIELMRQLVRNGPKQHPGAIFIFSGTRKIYLEYVDRNNFANNLKYGDVILRHMINGDYVLFNRQPSLHRLSIMCHRVRVHSDLTFKFNECVCFPYNADFDGDEMNVHFMQTEEAKAEAATLMQSKYNLTSPRNGDPVISPIQDFITSTYLMTKRDTFFDHSELCRLIAMLLDQVDLKKIKIPIPAIIKPKRLWTGKQLFSMILKPFEDSKIQLNLRIKTKAYSANEEMCCNEGLILFHNTEILAGVLDKSVLGSGSKKNIFYLILKESNPDESIRIMLRLCRVSSFFLSNFGFSIGIDDVIPTKSLLEQKEMLIRNGYAKVQSYIDQYKRGLLNSITGFTREQTLEELISGELSEIREHAGRACIKQLSRKNAPLTMANCGSKGSQTNISQMIVCVGQQSIRGQRVPEGFNRRVLPHFDYDDRSPIAKGFVANSFYSGLNPFEFFFHAMAGREGLLDTAVKTAETGYMQRRLIKGLEDLVVHYDYSVRNSDGEIVQFQFGDDCIDPINIEAKDSFVDFEYYWNHIMAIGTSNQTEPAAGVKQFQDFAPRLLAQSSGIPAFYKEKINDFFNSKVLPYIEAYENCKKKLTKPVTRSHIEEFIKKIERKFTVSKIDPGTAIGAICAQSIGEPTTQMTLKTFHFTGLKSMNITQGVPRITEIINATRTPSTPFMLAKLKNPYDVNQAEGVKLRIENVYLDEICEKIYQTCIDGCLCFILKLNTTVYKQLHLSESRLREEINNQLKPEYCLISFPYVKIFPSVKRMIYLPKIFEHDLSKVFISGNRHVERVTIHDDNGQYYLIVEGNGFLEVLGTDGIDSAKTRTNNIHEVACVLGIEAARATIIKEIKTTMGNNGIFIDERHLMLLADTMTASGNVVGMTRTGFSRVKNSTIKMASFERTVDNLYLASYYNNRDNLQGASECIIVGAPTRMGTGFFDIFPDITSKCIDFKRQKAETAPLYPEIDL